MARKEKPLLVENGIVVTLGENNKVIHGGAVLVKGGVIEEVGPSAKVARKASGAARIDARG
ncbi:MAG TPA: hypothetical protein PLI86_02670, partial [bacterium]|nr:hypothetical protein [bacterium]